MNIGVNMTLSSRSIDVAVLAQKAESLGFESLWLPEHPVIPVHVTTRYQGSPNGAVPPSVVPYHLVADDGAYPYVPGA